MKVWAKGCLFCGRKESRVWRIRKKRKREGEEDEGDKKDGKEEVEKICDGALSHLRWFFAWIHLLTRLASPFL